MRSLVGGEVRLNCVLKCQESTTRIAGLHFIRRCSTVEKPFKQGIEVEEDFQETLVHEEEVMSQ